jgi:Ring finger domain
MSTAEDVFYLYERNSSWYYDCKNTGIKQLCTNTLLNHSPINNTCFCEVEQIVKPITIGNQKVSCCLDRRCYIKPGTECPICYDQIIRRSDAYLTGCGHAFHKKCIFNAFKQKILYKYTSNFNCPMCRTRLGYELYDINLRYRQESKPNLDDLEQFWARQDFMIPEICCAGFNHYLGTNKECNLCLEYRETGR